MTTTTYKTLHFSRTTWQAATLSSALWDLMRLLHSRDANVQFRETQPDGTAVTLDGGPDEVCEVTELPVGDGVLTAQYIRNRGDSLNVSNMDILSLESLTADNVAVVFGATTAEYQIGVRAKDADVTESVFALLTDRLTLKEI